MRLLLVVVFIFSSQLYFAQSKIQDSLILLNSNFESVHTDSLNVQFKPDISLSPEKSIKRKEHRRITAALLCITLGPFGVHRLYLGTKPSVPVAYTLTLGGGIGVLPIIDFFIICFSRDLSKFSNNPNVIMWTEKEAGK